LVFGDGNSNDTNRVKMSPDGNFICITRATEVIDVIIMRFNESTNSFEDLNIETIANEYGDYYNCDINNNMAVFAGNNHAFPLRIFKKTYVNGSATF